MKLKVLSLFLLVTCVILQRCESLTCPKCTPEHKAKACQPLPNCPHGVTSDMCGCCEACFKGENEECGGIWNQGGFCASAFECAPNREHDQEPGICLRKAVP